MISSIGSRVVLLTLVPIYPSAFVSSFHFHFIHFPSRSFVPTTQLNNMGITKQSQKITREDLDEKLSLSIPSRELLEELAVKCAEDPTPDKTFQYAFCLSKSRQESELRYAVTILDSLVKEGYEHQIDCMIGSATALYLLGEFEQGQ